MLPLPAPHAGGRRALGPEVAAARGPARPGVLTEFLKFWALRPGRARAVMLTQAPRSGPGGQVRFSGGVTVQGHKTPAKGAREPADRAA